MVKKLCFLLTFLIIISSISYGDTLFMVEELEVLEDEIDLSDITDDVDDLEDDNDDLEDEIDDLKDEIDDLEDELEEYEEYEDNIEDILDKEYDEFEYRIISGSKEAVEKDMAILYLDYYNMHVSTYETYRLNRLPYSNQVKIEPIFNFRGYLSEIKIYKQEDADD